MYKGQSEEVKKKFDKFIRNQVVLQWNWTINRLITFLLQSKNYLIILENMSERNDNNDMDYPITSIAWEMVTPIAISLKKEISEIILRLTANIISECIEQNYFLIVDM